MKSKVAHIQIIVWDADLAPYAVIRRCHTRRNWRTAGAKTVDREYYLSMPSFLRLQRAQVALLKANIP